MQTVNATFLRTEADLAKSEARSLKAERIKTLGDPIQLSGKILDLHVLGDEVWTAESNAVVRRSSLISGKTIKLYSGHSGPASSLQIWRRDSQSLLISGSWDKSVKIWNAETKEVLSTTIVHGDFVKALLIIPELNILVTGSSDKSARIWDLSGPLNSQLRHLGTLSGHTRPIDCLVYDKAKPTRLYTGDSMGVIKVWDLEVDPDRSGVRGRLQKELKGHRTGVNSMSITAGALWTASTDNTFSIQPVEPTDNSRTVSIDHPSSVKHGISLLDLDLPYLITGSGESIYTYEVDSIGTKDGVVELLSVTDGHYHDICVLDIWMKTSSEGRSPEPWVISGSLDGTIRKWKLSELILPKPREVIEKTVAHPTSSFLTAEEERELEELLDSD